MSAVSLKVVRKFWSSQTERKCGEKKTWKVCSLNGMFNSSSWSNIMLIQLDKLSKNFKHLDFSCLHTYSLQSFIQHLSLLSFCLLSCLEVSAEKILHSCLLKPLNAPTRALNIYLRCLCLFKVRRHTREAEEAGWGGTWDKTSLCLWWLPDHQVGPACLPLSTITSLPPFEGMRECRPQACTNTSLSLQGIHTD